MSQTVREEHLKAHTPVQRDYKAEEVSKQVSKQVMEKLGTPTDFYRCTARKIGDTQCYRVNVWTSTTLLSSTVSTGSIIDSFWVKLDEEGVIVSPDIKKKY